MYGCMALLQLDQRSFQIKYRFKYEVCWIDWTKELHKEIFWITCSSLFCYNDNEVTHTFLRYLIGWMKNGSGFETRSCKSLWVFRVFSQIEGIQVVQNDASIYFDTRSPEKCEIKGQENFKNDQVSLNFIHKNTIGIKYS